MDTLGCLDEGKGGGQSCLPHRQKVSLYQAITCEPVCSLLLVHLHPLLPGGVLGGVSTFCSSAGHWKLWPSAPGRGKSALQVLPFCFLLLVCVYMEIWEGLGGGGKGELMEHLAVPFFNI